MTWSIYKDTEGPVEQWEENYAAMYIDYDVDTNHFPNKIKFLRDGMHHIWFGNQWTAVRVVNGQFAPTAHDQLLAIIAKDGYWGTFIEGFSKENGKLVVVVGS